MQPEAQATTHGSLEVGAGALNIAIVIQGALEVFWLTFYLYTGVMVTNTVIRTVHLNLEIIYQILNWTFRILTITREIACSHLFVVMHLKYLAQFNISTW